jgi:hypothetical protein
MGPVFFERPPENEPQTPGYANSPDFLRATMVEWSFVRHGDEMATMHSRDYFQWKSEQPLPVRIPTGLIATGGSNPDW